MEITGIVPMKGNSERVPGKNLRPIAGRPLFEWVLEALIDARRVDHVFVDTDSEKIADEVTARFPDVGIHIRPVELHGDLVPMHDIVAHLASVLPGDAFLQTHATNPLLTSTTIDKAIEAYEADEEHDSLMAVTPRQTRFFWEDGRPVNHDPAVLLRTQDLPPLMEENSNIYIASKDFILKTGRRVGPKALLFPMSAEESQDIDEEIDFYVAECLLKRRHG